MNLFQAAKARFHRPVRTQRIPTVEQDSGYWRVIIRANGQKPVDVTNYRGLPTQLGSMSFDDPYAENTFSLTFPGITIFDRRGWGELFWLVPDAAVDVVWTGYLPAGYPTTEFRWEGFLTSFDATATQLQVSCTGAMRQTDHFLAKPEYPAQPLPYEHAIARQFINRPSLALSPMRIEWPTWWKTKYADPAKGTPSYLIPSNVKAGDNWSGLLTRSTGSFDQALSSYVQTLLGAMYTARGRWTLDLDPGRKPVLRHRDFRTEPDDDIDVIVSAVDPDVEIQLSEDWSQSANVTYGRGTSLSGVAYSGMSVSGDGLSTSYVPLAAARQVEPPTDTNGWYQRGRFRRELMLELQSGLDEIDAQKAALAHLQRFGTPGYTGTITLGVDPQFQGKPIPRHLVRAGMSVRVPGILGAPEGLLLHVTSSTYDFSGEKASLTVDSLYRDALTVDEVRERGRDSLAVVRMLVAGQYKPPVDDQLYPWNYATGAGFIPSSPTLSSLRLFKDMPPAIRFPWTEWTTKRPPKSSAWRSSYVKLDPKSDNADKNWATVVDATKTPHGVPIQVSQAGSVRLIQIAAYDEAGNVLPVAFHVSLYYSKDVNVTSTPRLPASYASKYPPYAASQHYPFFPGAWESYNEDGTAINPGQNQGAVQTAGLIKAWGTNYEKAGYYPGSMAAGDKPTGLFVDEGTWQFDCTHFGQNYWDPLSAKGNLSNPLAAKIYMLIYCDENVGQPVYFAGRIFRAEPGSGT